MRKFFSWTSTGLLALVGLALSGCASFSRDGGLDTVAGLTQQRIGQPVHFSKALNTDQARLATLLGQTLSADSAVQIALLNNEGLKAALAELGVSEAELVQAGRMRNPGLSFGRISGAGDTEVERGIVFDIAGLLTLPARSGIAQGRFEQAKLQAALLAVNLAFDTRRVWFNAVAAGQTAGFMQQVRGAAQASSELAQQMVKAGNWSLLEQEREQVFHADAVVQLIRARQRATATREQLTRLLGLSSDQFTLPERLPDLPTSVTDINHAEAQALAQRLDLQIARRDSAALASALGLTRATAWINVLDAGYASKSQTGLARENGYRVGFELPIFDWGEAHMAKAEALYMQAVHRTADSALRARSEVRLAWSAYQDSYEMARHYRDQVVPLRKKISDEVLLRYNGMLASVFELLADSREQITSVNAAIEAQRDFWLADTALQAALNGAGTGNDIDTGIKP